MIAKERADESEHGELKRVVSAFLQMLDRFVGDSIIIAATNHERMLDIALWRRFDDVLYFGPPSASQAYELISLLLRRFGSSSGVRSGVLSQKLAGLSFSDVERLCIETIKRAILLDRRPIDSALLLEVAGQYAKHRRVAKAPSRRSR
jgi:SpoVK/Ycf46/Vps4 family AAA+-type ATPase